MELVRGKPLVAGADAQGLSTTQRLALLAQICDGVHHAHQKGVIHRDLKPGNILLSDAGVPKILDFGVARLSDADSGLATLETQPGQLGGTVPDRSPERGLGDSRQLGFVRVRELVP
jgi:serine/threonine protein kinase